MIYENINGWFDFQEVYELAIAEALKKPNTQFMAYLSLFIEVGAWLGRSTAYMAERLMQTGANAKFLVYDTWEGGGELDLKQQFPGYEGDNIYPLFAENMKDLKDYFIPFKHDSLSAVLLHPVNSVDFVFLDDCHDKIHVAEELPKWYARVKPGGILAGHDYGGEWQGVKEAVDEFAGQNNLTFELFGELKNSWVFRK